MLNTIEHFQKFNAFADLITSGQYDPVIHPTPVGYVEYCVLVQHDPTERSPFPPGVQLDVTTVDGQETYTLPVNVPTMNEEATRAPNEPASDAPNDHASQIRDSPNRGRSQTRDFRNRGRGRGQNRGRGQERRPVASPAVIERESFGVTPEGQRVTAFTLTNASGMQVRFTEYGGIILAITVPDRSGVPAAGCTARRRRVSRRGVGPDGEQEDRR